MKKMGRPKSNNPKNIDIKVRIDSETNKKLLNYCKENNLTKAEVLRIELNRILEK